MPSPWDRGRGAPPLGAAGAARGHPSKEAAMHHRRLVGIDLGIISAHTVRVLAGDGSVVCRRKAVPTVASLTETEQAALQGAAPTTRLEVVLEPTGPSWLPIAVFFTSRGHTVYRVSSARAHDLRRVLSRQAKSNGIDADTLARLPLVDPAGLHPLALPSAERAALDRRVRACDRLTQQGACHKRRIKDLVRQLLPTSPLAGELGMADLAVLERFGADPHALLAAGPGRLARLIGKASGGQHGQQRATHWLAAARAALQLYGDHPAVAFTDLAAAVHTEVRLLRATDTARRQDPQLARLYYVQMVQRGKDHLGTVCVVAAHLAERAWAVMDRGMPYVICDIDGTPV